MSPKKLFLLIPVVLAISVPSFAAKYNGPRPPKPDIPYLMHADNLVSTEITDAKEESKKGETVYSVPGTNSSARTPLAEPIFLMTTQNLSADKLDLFRMDVRNGRREVSVSQKKTKKGRPLRLAVTRLDDNLYRIEVDQNLGLENGQYALTPEGSNQVFCFEVY